jgi:hypothetical protein
MCDVTRIAEAINDSAKTLDETANRLRSVSRKMLERNDVDGSIDAVNALVGSVQNMRIDLIVMRIIDAMNRRDQK